MDLIVKHSNYSSLPNKFKENGEIRWVSPSDKLRAEWWDQKKAQMHYANRAEVARQIHPKEMKGLKPCQICGKSLSIFYIYPRKNILKKLNSIDKRYQFTSFNENIDDIIALILEKFEQDGVLVIREIFNIPQSVDDDKNSLQNYIKEFRKTRLSPGSMSNPPDRLDGFHTYNACCRSVSDTGRHSKNLARYTQDRRVYENWAEGNWNLSNRLMGEYSRYSDHLLCSSCHKLKKMTADHIGPISLGFTHRPHFNPLCRECNSQKNNKMSYEDVQSILVDEKNGDKVVSWHTKYIWNRLKLKVKNQEDALNLSKLMRANLHHVLLILAKIYASRNRKFLDQFLHPEYSYVDYRFEGFHPFSGPKNTITMKIESKNKTKNAKRYVRISYETLKLYNLIENRNSKIWKSKNVDKIVENLLRELSVKNYDKAKVCLESALDELSKEAEAIFDAKS